MGNYDHGNPYIKSIERKLIRKVIYESKPLIPWQGEEPGDLSHAGTDEDADLDSLCHTHSHTLSLNTLSHTLSRQGGEPGAAGQEAHHVEEDQALPPIIRRIYRGPYGRPMPRALWWP